MRFHDYDARSRRMRLRPYVPSDYDNFYDLHRREDVARHLPWPPRSESAATVALERHFNPRLEESGDHLTLAADDVDTSRLVGEFVLILRSTIHQQGEIGYILHPDFAGRGLATEGAQHMLDLAFSELMLHKVVARTSVANAASARVLDKVGMRREGHLLDSEYFKGRWNDEFVYGMVRPEWESLRGGGPSLDVMAAEGPGHRPAS